MQSNFKGKRAFVYCATCNRLDRPRCFTLHSLGDMFSLVPNGLPMEIDRKESEREREGEMARGRERARENERERV